MFRLLLTVAGLLACARPAFAERVSPAELPELVGWADVIVVGVPAPALFGVWDGDRYLDGYNFRVSDVLLGDAGPRVEFAQWLWHDLRAEPQIVFLFRGEPLPQLVHPFAQPAARADDVRRLVRMKADLVRSMRDPAVGGTVEFLQLLRESFAYRRDVNGCDRPTAAAHARRQLTAADPDVVLAASAVLLEIDDKDSARDVIPLLKHREAGVQRSAVRYLYRAYDRTAVRPLCALLDTLSDCDLAHEVAAALGALGSPAAQLALERAVKRRVQWATWALGNIGDESCVGVLLEALTSGDDHAAAGLRELVRRSNKKEEDWMRGDGDLAAKWREWWEANKATFKLKKLD